MHILGGMICDSLRLQGGRLGQLIRGVIQAPKLHTYHRRRSSQTLMCLVLFALQIPQLAALQPAEGPPESPFEQLSSCAAPAFSGLLTKRPWPLEGNLL